MAEKENVRQKPVHYFLETSTETYHLDFGHTTTRIFKENRLLLLFNTTPGCRP